MNRLSVHWIPAHNRESDYNYISALKPQIMKIVNFDVNQIARIYAASPNTTFVLRNHSLSEEHDAMQNDPVNTGIRHADWWRNRYAEMVREAKERNVVIPPISQYIVLGINEPHVWSHLAESVTYNVSFGNRCNQNGLIAGLMNLSVGWPGNDGIEDHPPIWEPYEPILPLLKAGNYLVLHEYWSKSGPNVGWGWYAGRFTTCPWDDIKIIIGECGVDQAVIDMSNGHRGWKHFMDAEQYSQQLYDYIMRCARDIRFTAAMPFTTDYGSRDWETFDTEPLHNILLSKNWFVPFVTNPSSKPIERPQPEIKPVPDLDANWNKAIEWILKWEGGFQNNPADIGNYYNGQLIGTKYGISAASWAYKYDIPNLTLDEAKQIYHEYYWKASGADKLSWPLSLLVMDTAVLHGTGTAIQWLKEVGPDPYKFAAKRLKVYTKLKNWKDFGAAWVNRVADLLQEMA